MLEKSSGGVPVIVRRKNERIGTAVPAGGGYKDD
jgi:hypothetical protein